MLDRHEWETAQLPLFLYEFPSFFKETQIWFHPTPRMPVSEYNCQKNFGQMLFYSFQILLEENIGILKNLTCWIRTTKQKVLPKSRSQLKDCIASFTYRLFLKTNDLPQPHSHCECQRFWITPQLLAIKYLCAGRYVSASEVLINTLDFSEQF